MPELPEVETTVRGLRKRVVGLKIVDFWCDWPKMIRYVTPDKIRKEIKNKKIIAARRRGKNVLIDLNNKKSLVIHMKMTGHLMYGKYLLENKTWTAQNAGPLRDDPYNKYIHVLFALNNNYHLVFSDTRKFGKISLCDTDKLSISKELAHLGPELWEIKASEFVRLLEKRGNGRIKSTLMNQEVIAGIGNIYSDEGLWSAGIHPLAQIKNTSQNKLEKLYRALIKITKRALKTGGDSTSDYRNIDGDRGRFQNFHRAYRQTGKKCCRPGCTGTIKRIVISSRGAHFCPDHQKM